MACPVKPFALQGSKEGLRFCIVVSGMMGSPEKLRHPQALVTIVQILIA